jgi:diguanylate cyclase
VLLCLAQRLTSDAEEKDFLARYGGEEFAVLLRNTDLEKAADRLSATIQRVAGMDYEYQNGGQTSRLRFTCSAGLAEFAPGEQVEELVKRADRALSEAKRAGKNRATAKRRGLLSSIPWLRAS